mmetsp:Transcript_1796/g.3990  ORF Transcript_1796/g.3990 Transcript_1796/m.3990 type:complete len:232 (+) Transcript_1796:1435-2130(+)
MPSSHHAVLLQPWEAPRHLGLLASIVQAGKAPRPSQAVLSPGQHGASQSHLRTIRAHQFRQENVGLLFAAGEVRLQASDPLLSHLLANHQLRHLSTQSQQLVLYLGCVPVCTRVCPCFPQPPVLSSQGLQLRCQPLHFSCDHPTCQVDSTLLPGHVPNAARQILMRCRLIPPGLDRLRLCLRLLFLLIGVFILHLLPALRWDWALHVRALLLDVLITLFLEAKAQAQLAEP